MAKYSPMYIRDLFFDVIKRSTSLKKIDSQRLADQAVVHWWEWIQRGIQGAPRFDFELDGVDFILQRRVHARHKRGHIEYMLQIDNGDVMRFNTENTFPPLGATWTNHGDIPTIERARGNRLYVDPGWSYIGLAVVNWQGITLETIDLAEYLKLNRKISRMREFEERMSELRIFDGVNQVVIEDFDPSLKSLTGTPTMFIMGMLVHDCIIGNVPVHFVKNSVWRGWNSRRVMAKWRPWEEIPVPNMKHGDHEQNAMHMALGCEYKAMKAWGEECVK